MKSFLFSIAILVAITVFSGNANAQLMCLECHVNRTAPPSTQGEMQSLVEDVLSLKKGGESDSSAHPCPYMRSLSGGEKQAASALGEQFLMEPVNLKAFRRVLGFDKPNEHAIREST